MVEHRVIQSVIFKKDMFTASQAIAWLIEHNYSYGNIHTTEKYHRFRQFDPDYSNPDKIHITVKSKYPGIKYIMFIDRSDMDIIKRSSV